MKAESANLVILEYSDLVEGRNLSEQIKQAFGFDGLGLLAVRGVPNFADLRQNLLPLARQFALLPDEIKAKYEHADSMYSFGWSHGKEKFDGAPDYHKGSYYANPQYDRPVDDEDLIKQYPAFIHPNIWPNEEMPELREAFMACGQLIVEVGKLVAKQCDDYVRSVCASYPANMLNSIISNSPCCKGRLLHYFAHQPTGNEQAREDSWCGWHNDHGSLTGLCPGMFLDLEGNVVPNPDPKAGLYIRTRQGRTVKAVLPGDCMAFQIGETAQVHSGGLLQATPHCVMGADGTTPVSRESFAVFMEPDWSSHMNVPEGVDPAQAMMGSKKELLPPGVPLLEIRWNPGQSFGDFTASTLKHYYEYA